MSKKQKDAPKQVSSDEIRGRIVEQEANLQSLEAASAEVFDDLMTSPDDAGKVAAMRAAATAVTEAKELLARLSQSLQRATVREQEALTAAQAKIHAENLSGITVQRRIMGRQAIELEVRFSRYLDEWARFLASAEKVRGLLLPEHRAPGGAHTSLMPLKLRTLVERELYRLGGTGTAAQVMHDGNIRSLAAPGCTTPQGLSLVEKSAPSTVQSLEARIDALFASILNEPLRSPPAHVIAPTPPSATEPASTPVEPAAGEFSSDPEGYAAELQRMHQGLNPVEPADGGIEPEPAEDTEEFKAALEELRWRTEAKLRLPRPIPGEVR
jgi:hypothetical protein